MNPMIHYTRDKLYKPKVKFSKTAWEPPPVAWLKWNIDAFLTIAKSFNYLSTKKLPRGQPSY